MHALGLGAGLWLYVADAPADTPPQLRIQLAEIVEPRHAETDPVPPPAPDEHFKRPEEIELPASPVLPPDTPADDTDLPPESARPPLRPLQLLPEVTVRAVRVRVRVAPPPPPPPPVPPAPTEPRHVPRRQPGVPLRVTYVPDLRRYYPREMQLRGIEGTVQVGFDVDRAGRVTNAWIVRTSGWPLLDRQALRVMYDHRFAAGDGGRAQRPVDFRLE